MRQSSLGESSAVEIKGLTSNPVPSILIVKIQERDMKVIRRHYKSVAEKNYGLRTWSTETYRAFDFYWGKHLFVLGFEKDKK